MDIRPQTTIVIPLLSQPDEWLEQCVISALQQTLPSPVIVITAPTTCTSNLSLLQRLSWGHPQLQWFQQRMGGGFADAINEGWGRADTPRVGLLLSDDWLEPDAVEQCLAFDAEIVSTGEIVHADDGRVLWENPHSQAIYDAIPTLERKAAYLNHFFLFRREAVLAVGGVDNQVGEVGPDDYDLPWTLLERGAEARVVDKMLYHYRDHLGQRLTLRPREAQLHDLEHVLRKHRVEPDQIRRMLEQRSPLMGVPVQVARRRRMAKGFPRGN